MIPNTVVFVNSYGSVNGGATRVAIDEAAGLARRGISVIFLAAVGPVSDELASRHLRVICLGQNELIDAPRSPSVAFQGIWNSSAYHAMREILECADRRTTIVHVHGFSNAMSASPIHCALQMGFRTICTLHDYFLVCPNGAFFDFPSGKECERAPLSLSCELCNCDKRNYFHKLYRVLRTRFQRQICGLPSSLKNYISLSTVSTAKVRPYLPKEARIFSLPNPCLVPRRPPVNVSANNAVLFVGRLDPEKGIEFLVDAARFAGTRLLFVGDGPLRRFAEQNGKNRVTGWLGRQDVLKTLESARSVVFPSLWPETFGLTVMDAAARGVPAIVTDIAGVAERVADGITGWHVRVGDVQGLAARLRDLSDADAVSAAGAAAYDLFWKNPLTEESHINGLLNIYDAILTGEAQH